MTYKTYWLAGLLAPMLVAHPAFALKADIVCSSMHTAFIQDGALYAMGSNSFGQTLPGSTGNVLTPVFTGDLDVEMVAIAQNRTAILKKDGTAVLRGYSLVVRGPATSSFPMSDISDIALQLLVVYFVKDGVVYTWTGESTGTPTPIPGGTNVKSIAAGSGHLLVLFNDGTVGTFGTTNTLGQLGDGTVLPNAAIVPVPLPEPIDAIAAGPQTSFAVTANGAVYGWGKNTSYELGFADGVNRLTPAKMTVSAVSKILPGSGLTSVIHQDGYFSTTGWHNYIGDGFYNTSTKFWRMPYGFVVDGCTGGLNGTVIRQKDTVNQLAGLGTNTAGQLGLGDIAERHTLGIAYYTPVVLPPPPVVVAPPVPEVVATPEPAAPAPEPTDTAIALPFNPVEPPVVVVDPPTIIDVVVDAVVDAVLVVVDAVVTVVDAVVEAITPTPVPAPTPEPVVVPQVVVVTPPVVIPPVVAPPIVVTKPKHENNGFGNGDQAAPGKSADKNNAENSTRPMPKGITKKS